MSKVLPKPSLVTQLAWRIFYVFNCFLVFLQVASLPAVPVFGVMEVLDLVVSLALFVALSGFVFFKGIGAVIYWRYFFYVALVEVVVVLVVFPVFKLPLYGALMTTDSWLLNLGYLGLNLWALNLYAFKYRFIWVSDLGHD